MRGSLAKRIRKAITGLGLTGARHTRVYRRTKKARHRYAAKGQIRPRRRPLSELREEALARGRAEKRERGEILHRYPELDDRAPIENLRRWAALRSLGGAL